MDLRMLCDLSNLMIHCKMVEERMIFNISLCYYAFLKNQPSLLLQEYEALTKQPACNPDVWVNLACTYFFLGMYMQAEQAALKGEMYVSDGKNYFLT